MNILVISRSPWRNDNSFGNTYSNIFDGMPDVNIANIFLADGKPDSVNSVVKKYYQISETAMVKSVLRPFGSGRVGEAMNDVTTESDAGSKSDDDGSIKSLNIKRLNIFYIFREIIWKFGKANLDGMMEFVNDFKPDIIFLPFYYAVYVDRIAWYIKKHISVPLVLEASIDIYSMNQISFDPFFWINRLFVRRAVRKTVALSEKLYVVSEKMKSDYEKMLGIDCGVLYKFTDSKWLSGRYPGVKDENAISFLYTGNVGNRRWESLGTLGEAVEKYGIGHLDVYTPTPLNSKMLKKMSSCTVHEPVSAKEVKALQGQADVLVHAESFNRKDMLAVRYSISTKVMDYISACRCILAIGPEDIASVNYLESNNLALICKSNDDIEKTVQRIKNDKSVISECAEHNFDFVSQMPDRESQQAKLKDDLQNIITQYKG